MVDRTPGKGSSEIVKMLTGGRWGWLKKDVNTLVVQYIRYLRNVN